MSQNRLLNAAHSISDTKLPCHIKLFLIAFSQMEPVPDFSSIQGVIEKKSTDKDEDFGQETGEEKNNIKVQKQSPGGAL